MTANKCSARSHFDRASIEVTRNFDPVKSLRSRGVTSMDALAALQGHGSPGEEEVVAEDWDGRVPLDVTDWCKALHALISSVHGDGSETGIEPRWAKLCPVANEDKPFIINLGSGPENDGMFVEDEEKRRGLTYLHALCHFTSLPYLRPNDLVTMDYTTCKNDKREGILFGTGEQFGVWQAFTLFYAMPGMTQVYPLQTAMDATVGGKEVVVARILRSTKPAGEGKTQNCFYALLHFNGAFEYAALQHVVPDDAYGDGGFNMDWDQDNCYSGFPAPGANQMVHFVPKSVSAVAKAAAKFTSECHGSGKKPKKRKQRSDTSDDESD